MTFSPERTQPGCERATIEARLAELRAAQAAATGWGAAVGARHEEIKSLEGRLRVMTQTLAPSVEILAIADDYEAGLNRALASGYEEFGVTWERRQRLIITALRQAASMQSSDVRGIEANFFGWLMEDIDTVTAEVKSPRDAQLKEFEAQGFLRFKGTWADTNAYEITSKGALSFAAHPVPTANAMAGRNAPGDATHVRRPEYLTAWLFDRKSTMPIWLITKYQSRPLPDDKIGHYATATDGEFWRWFDPAKFNEMFIALTPPAPTPTESPPYEGGTSGYGLDPS